HWYARSRLRSPRKSIGDDAHASGTLASRDDFHPLRHQDSTTATMTTSLYLYTTSGCHLCEQAEAIVTPHLVRFGLVLERIEIAGSDELMARYGVRIPVLRIEGEEAELGWPFTEEGFVEFVEAGERR